MPGYRRSVINYVLPNPDGSAPAYDGIGETWFASAEAFQSAMASPEGQAVFADTPNFLDVTQDAPSAGKRRSSRPDARRRDGVIARRAPGDPGVPQAPLGA